MFKRHNDQSQDKREIYPCLESLGFKVSGLATYEEVIRLNNLINQGLESHFRPRFGLVLTQDEDINHEAVALIGIYKKIPIKSFQAICIDFKITPKIYEFHEFNSPKEAKKQKSYLVLGDIGLNILKKHSVEIAEQAHMYSNSWQKNKKVI